MRSENYSAKIISYPITLKGIDWLECIFNPFIVWDKQSLKKPRLIINNYIINKNA